MDEKPTTTDELKPQDETSAPSGDRVAERVELGASNKNVSSERWRKKISERQLLANRANGRRSRGPVTEAGKRTSSKNALRHGIFSGELLLNGENGNELKVFREKALGEWKPEGLEEQLLVERFVMGAWRLRRVLKVERQVFDSMSETSKEFRTGHLVSLFREDLFSKVVRYQGHAGRELERILKLLRKAQKRRQECGAKDGKLDVEPGKEEAA